MPVNVANVDVNANDTFQDWIDRTNEAIAALRTIVITTNANTASGNAVVNGSVEMLSLHVGNVYGGTIGAAANINIISNTVFAANVDFNGSRIWASGNKIWHAGNDGPGSGLDADTLDGVQLSALARTDTAESFSANVSVLGQLFANQASTFANTMTVNGDATFNADVTFEGEVTFSNPLVFTTANVANLEINGVAFNPSAYALLSGATFTGNIAAPTVANTTSSNVVATTAYVQNNLTAYAKLSGANFTGNVNVTGNIFATGDITSGSDRRLKDNIETITNALELVKQLRGVRFTKSGRQTVGLIAQEVRPIVPGVVYGDEKTDYLTLTYGNLVGVLVEAIKELAQRIEELEAK